MKVDQLYRRIFFTAVLLRTCQAASAQEDCRLTDTLKRVHASSVLMFDNPAGGIMESNLRRVQAELSFLDADVVTRQISQQLTHEGSISVLLHFHLMADLVEVAETGNRSEFQTLLLKPINAQIASAAGPNIAKLGCVPFTSTNETITQNDSAKAAMGAATGDTIFFQAFKMAQSYAPLIGFAALVIVSWWGNRYISRHLKRQRIRAKRYYLYMYVSFATGPMNYRGAILDISRLGTKLRHRRTTSVPEKAPIRVQLNGVWRAGKVMWSSDDYCGIKFNMRLTRKELRAIRQAAAGAVQPNEKVHPQVQTTP